MRDDFFNDGSRGLQDRFETRPLADRIVERVVRRELSEDDRAFIEQSSMFFLATADAEGRPDCSYKGGDPGFVHVVDGATLAFPSYDGNGMFRSVGNLTVNPHVGMLFIDFENPKRVRVNGRATVHHQHELLARYPEADLLVEVAIDAVFPNCPRYIHRLARVEASPYVPRAGCETPRPAWKDSKSFRDVLRPRDRQPAK
jgi:predicted pyridoxine 5'-phosphate oxidase superfamily flavin-nucleotide-binding protein